MGLYFPDALSFVSYICSDMSTVGHEVKGIVRCGNIARYKSYITSHAPKHAVMYSFRTRGGGWTDACDLKTHRLIFNRFVNTVFCGICRRS